LSLLLSSGRLARATRLGSAAPLPAVTGAGRTTASWVSAGGRRIGLRWVSTGPAAAQARAWPAVGANHHGRWRPRPATANDGRAEAAGRKAGHPDAAAGHICVSTRRRDDGGDCLRSGRLRGSGGFAGADCSGPHRGRRCGPADGRGVNRIDRRPARRLEPGPRANFAGGNFARRRRRGTE